MIKIVNEIQSGLTGIKTACLKYGLCRNTLKLFITKLSIRTLGDDFSTQIRSRMNDSQKPYFLESSLNDSRSCNASIATFALKAAECFCLFDFIMHWFKVIKFNFNQWSQFRGVLYITRATLG